MLPLRGMAIHAQPNPLTPTQATHLLDGFVHAEVCEHVDFLGLVELEERVAIELGRLPDITDDQMLGLARAMVARALYALASGYQRGKCSADPALQTRYLNAICRVDDQGAEAK